MQCLVGWENHGSYSPWWPGSVLCPSSLLPPFLLKLSLHSGVKNMNSQTWCFQFVLFCTLERKSWKASTWWCNSSSKICVGIWCSTKRRSRDSVPTQDKAHPVLAIFCSSCPALRLLQFLFLATWADAVGNAQNVDHRSFAVSRWAKRQTIGPWLLRRPYHP